jgi:NitT/TauT family transport system ATP-binding protein
VNAPTATPEIHLDRVSKTFARPGGDEIFRAVEDLTLAIAPGELVALLGKTGCGKSTIFNMIAGLGAPSGGKVLVQGRDPFREFDWFRGKIAIVFQSDRLLPWRTAIGNVELGLDCDEPFSALDEHTAQRLREEFVALVRQNRKTAVFITHSISEALQVGDRIVVLRRPARIAYDVRVSRVDEHAAIRQRIQEILAE